MAIIYLLFLSSKSIFCSLGFWGYLSTNYFPDSFVILLLPIRGTGGIQEEGRAHFPFLLLLLVLLAGLFPCSGTSAQPGSWFQPPALFSTTGIGLIASLRGHQQQSCGSILLGGLSPSSVGSLLWAARFWLVHSPLLVPPALEVVAAAEVIISRWPQHLLFAFSAL